MTSKHDPRKHRGYPVYVVCQITERPNGTAEIWFRERRKTFNIRAQLLRIHPITRETLCSVKLLGTNEGVGTVLVRQTNNVPTEAEVHVSRTYCEFRGELLKFHSWKDLIRRRKLIRNGKENRRREKAS